MTGQVQIAVELRADALLMASGESWIISEPKTIATIDLRPSNRMPAHTYVRATMYLRERSLPDWQLVRWEVELDARRLGAGPGAYPGILYLKPLDVPCEVIHFGPGWEADPQEAAQIEHMWPEHRDLRQLLDTAVWSLSYRVAAVS